MSASVACTHDDFECVCGLDLIDHHGAVCFSRYEQLHFPGFGCIGCVLYRPNLGRQPTLIWQQGRPLHRGMRMVDEMYLHDLPSGHVAVLNSQHCGAALPPDQLSQMILAIVQSPLDVTRTYIVPFEILAVLALP